MRLHIAAALVLALAACGGDPASDRAVGLMAEKLGRVPGPGACGVENALRVTEAAGIRL
ncbi:MAG: hypothetical protein HKM96_10315, partial [Boseongicola sp.]|nr:hypothetical protein [Boseongicola sp.]